MHLSWNEIRARAARFADAWKNARYERGESQTFYNEFFEIFGVTRRRVASFEEPVRLLGNKRGFIDLFWKGVLLVEQKSGGRDLQRAKQQALEYFPGLKESELPRYVLVSDFQNFELYDLEEGVRPVCFVLRELPHFVESFTFILGVQKRTFRDQDPANIEASELMGQLHDALKLSGYVGHDLERFLVRLLFCLFADHTGIFEPQGIFYDLLTQRTRQDGSDVGALLSQLFEVLNKEEGLRDRTLDEDLARFRYINGDLFRERLPIPSFNAQMRELLIDSGRRSALEKFQDKLSTLRYLDPACGCGNFLIIAYRELRVLELALLKEIFAGELKSGQRNIDVATLSKINVDQFYGIEIAEFPARIAEVALWMMDHIMNNRLSLQFGDSYARIPLKTSPHIHNSDALETDWSTVLPPDQCSYVFGNPPFIGSKYQTPVQRAQVRRIAGLGGSGGTLDYVTAWFLRAGEYVRLAETPATIGFVATSSITQGEQVAQLWPLLFDRYRLEIAFAHRTFAWGSDARGMAHVHVVIIGLVAREHEPAFKRLFSYSDIRKDPVESQHMALTPYLFDASNVIDRHLVVESESKPLCQVPRMIIGSKPIDDGNYIFDSAQRAEFLSREPKAEKFLRPFVGATEFLYGVKRWILHLGGVSPAELRVLPAVMERIAAVKASRQRSTSKPTQELADTPMRFHVTVIPERPFLVIPEVSSEHRDYVPIGWLAPPTIPSNLVRVLLDADLWHFGVLTSRMHMSWMRQIGGRLESRYRYSIGIVYNPFPWPEADEQQKSKIRSLAQAVLNARLEFPDATLADLYDADVMQPRLRRAHQALDSAVEKLYRTASFSGGDRERVEHLFRMYEALVLPPLIPIEPRPKRKGRTRRVA